MQDLTKSRCHKIAAMMLEFLYSENEKMPRVRFPGEPRRAAYQSVAERKTVCITILNYPIAWQYTAACVECALNPIFHLYLR